MRESIYEQHRHPDPKFPIIFHYDLLDTYHEKFSMHYHENIEILYFVKGEGYVRCGKNRYDVKVGDIVVINSNELHSVTTTCDELKYYCLIVDKEFCEESGISVDKLQVKSWIQDEELKSYIETIAREMQLQNTYYKTVVKSIAIVFLASLHRKYGITIAQEQDETWNHKMDTVRLAIAYIKQNFTQTITVEDICKEVGFSKFHMCRIFKEITGQTIIEYINFLKCDYARTLLMTGKCNVKESAEICGFQNLSYFSKTYKKYMGQLPSKENNGMW